jgi:hypothetical protein
MEIKKKQDQESEEKTWENPGDPEKPTDERDKEQIERQYREAKRRKDNLTEKDHIDKKHEDRNNKL